MGVCPSADKDKSGDAKIGVEEVWAKPWHAVAPVPLIVISDPGQDLDDEMAYIMLRYLKQKNLVDIRGIVTTLYPAFDRARLCRGSLDVLGLYDVPVGIGTDGGDLKGEHKRSTFEEWAHAYMSRAYRINHLEPGGLLLGRLFERATPKSLTVLVIASLKDVAIFLRDNEQLFVNKCREVVIMGGVEAFDSKSDKTTCLTPDSAHNQKFDPESSKYLYSRCQQLGVPLVVVSRWAAYAAKVPQTCYDDLASMGSVIGCRLRNAQRASIENLWVRACAPEGDNRRAGLPVRCDREWFLKTFCDDNEDGKSRGITDSIWDLVTGFMQYDSIALLACVPDLRSKFFDPIRVRTPRAENLVIGLDSQTHGISDSKGLAKLLNDGFHTGLALNNRYRPHFILLAEPLWNNVTDELLACTMLGTLYSLGAIACDGIVISPDKFASAASDEGCGSTNVGCRSSEIGSFGSDQVNKIKEVLCSIGLANIPVFISESGSDKCVEDLRSLYEHVGPTGVTLIVIGVLGNIQRFASAYPILLREKTQVIIHRGAALIETEMNPDGTPITGHPWLNPDPGARSIAYDMDAAKSFYRMMQESLIPMLIISHHCVYSCTMPLSIFDYLNNNGGSRGREVYNTWKSSVEKLWKASNALPGDTEARCGLPDNLDREWFLRQFCRPGSSATDEDLMSTLQPFMLRTSLAILAVLPQVMTKCFNVKTVTVRSVEHRIIGVNEAESGIKDLNFLRQTMYQCFFKGLRLNLSEFELDRHRLTIRLDDQSDWDFDHSESGLQWLRPNDFQHVSEI